MASPTPHHIPLSSAPLVASYSLQVPDHPEIEIAQAEHRIKLVNFWQIAPGSRVLELGCGQGNATAVLAHAVGPDGHVDAVDPGAPDYGSPFTLAQAQAHISNGPVGPQVAWHNATPEGFLEQTTEKWDVAVLSHCIWYFATPSVLTSILGCLRGRVDRICVAEYALHASEKAASPHVLSVLARSMLESYKPESSENIRSPLGPRAIKEIASACGWVVRDETTIIPEPGLLDGTWEVGSVKSKGFLAEIDGVVKDERTRLVLNTARDAVVAAVE
ncbi:hypothetical protein HK405_003729, partial [Cladochytrium tenue]